MHYKKYYWILAIFIAYLSTFPFLLQGGVVFITIKGVLRIYHKQQQHIRQLERKILDFSDHPPAPPETPAAGRGSRPSSSSSAGRR